MSHKTDHKSQVLQRFLLLGASRDYDGMRAILTEDIRIVQAPSLPFGGEYIGWPGYLEVTNKLFGSLRKVKLELKSTWHDQDDSLVAHFELMAISKRTCQNINMPLLELWEFKGNKVCAITPYYFDSHFLSESL